MFYSLTCIIKLERKKMEFSNALRGIKKIRTSEILSLIVAVLGAVGGGLILSEVRSAKTVENAVSAGGGAVVGGSINIARKLGNEDMAQRGTKLVKIIIALYVIVLIIKLLETILGSGDVVKAISGVLAIVAGILSIVILITYLKYLGRAVRMIEQA